MEEIIKIRGARENNLKDVDIDIPRNKFVVLTGVSGSGKTTLAFDTIFAEGQRRYVESLSSYARMFLGQMAKPDVDLIEGLSPAISIDQKTTSHNPRSTVGTVTEIYDYLRLLFARVGDAYCHKCGKKIEKLSIDNIADRILMRPEGEKIMLEAPVVRGQKGTHAKLIDSLRKQGFVRAEIDGEVVLLEDKISLDKNIKHNISVVVDRLIVGKDILKRLTDSLEVAVKLSEGLVAIKGESGESEYNTNYTCANCGSSIPEISPRLFSFNSPFGACSECSGLGFTVKVDPELVLAKKDKSINGGAFNIFGFGDGIMAKMFFKGLAKKFGFSLATPVKDLPKEALDAILYGTKDDVELTHGNKKYYKPFEGIVSILERRYKETASELSKNEYGKYMRTQECPHCKGKRLSNEALSVKVNGLNIVELCDKSVADIKKFFADLKLEGEKKSIATPILKEINARLNFLINVGLDYLTLSRTASTLSGGEAQRIRLATQIGSGLAGVLYILDEPSIGLHQRDNEKLISALKNLRDLGNSLIVVEHDEDTMREADYIVDVGPKAGVHGGKIVAKGSIDDLINEPKSITGKYLSGEREIKVPAKRLKPENGYLKIYGAEQNNLKKANISIPAKVFTCVTGVSGSGKSSFVNEIVYPLLANKLNRASLTEGKYKKAEGVELFDKVINIDQSPIGRTPRSNPSTYTGVFNYIRDLFAATPDAKERGFDAGRFSFNVTGGRCEACGGAGVKKIEMYFLPDVYVECDECHAQRYNRETLEVRYKGKNIFEALDMTVEEALKFFENIPSIKAKMQALYDVGLGYIKLGQPATTLSGGEAQRVKLATELAKRSTGKTFYILDEPTTGLHFYDVEKLVDILKRLTASGNTVLVIEHNLDVIKTADYIIDLGPEGGVRGGEIVCTGTPEEVAQHKGSYTGKFLKKVLNKNKK